MSVNKKVMSDEERLALAEKLDCELEEYINSLEKKPYTEGWPEERWQEEMEKHPFFMTKFPENEEVSPLLQGLQQLKYDETLNTPKELALSYKEDGLFNFKHKKYRIAIISFTEGLKQKCQDEKLNAQLLNNRSACHFMLGNYRSSIQDCKQTLKIDPNYTKAQIRLAQCYLYTSKFDECLSQCEFLLKENPKLDKIVELKNSAYQKKKISERNIRKEAYKEKKKNFEETNILEEIKKRNIKLINKERKEILSIQDLQQNYVNERVHLLEGRLIWPVIFLYPEYETSDYIQEFNEDIIFKDQLLNIFEETPEWDKNEKYKVNSINVYVEESGKKVDINLTLGEILTKNKCMIINGVPTFLIVLKNSVCEKKVLGNYS